MNPHFSQKDNELISNTPTIRNQKKVPTDSDDKQASMVQKEPIQEKENNISFDNTASPKKDIITNLLESKAVNPENINLMSNSNAFTPSSEYIKSIKKVMDQAKKLHVKIAVSSTLQKGQILEISPLGYNNSIRDNNGDGFTFFGFLTDEELKDNKSIDFLIKPKEENFESRFKGKHFQIRFNPLDLKYYICDLGNGFGTFVKLTDEIVIKDNYLINIGNSYIVLIFDDEGTEGETCQNSTNMKTEKILVLKIFSGNDKYDPIPCNYKEKKKIVIGRDEECDVSMDDSLLSRFHCTIIYKDGIGWSIIDGSINDNGDVKKSTNGTWLYLMEETEIANGMVFKGNQNVFKCTYVA